jgi:phosphoglycerate kinase
MIKKTVRDIDVKGKKALVRVDFNVPVDINTGAITDDSRIRAAIPTILYLLEHNARVILMSHMGRPKGKASDELKLAPVAERLSKILGKEVKTTPDCIGPEVEQAVSKLADGEVLMLENLRFNAGEETGNAEFAGALAKLGDVYVNDAFGTSHRAHASMAGITKYLPAVAGFLLEKEVDTLGGLLESPAHPFTALFGGAKVSDKVALLRNIMDRVDCVLIGGGMAATFLKSQSREVGKSKIEEETVEVADELVEEARKHNVRLLLPVDVMVAAAIDIKAEGDIVPVEDIPQDKMIVDIGPRTVDMFIEQLQESKTVFWNGPVGIEEIPQFASGTHTMANVVAGLKATTVIGGGSTAEVINSMGLAEKVSFVSTGGGASLEFLGGDELPGVVALLDKG